MLADSSRVFSHCWNMWKKLVFYISQLVASSADWPLTPYRDSNTHKGSVPKENWLAFPETARLEREALSTGRFMSCHTKARGTTLFQHTWPRKKIIAARWGGKRREPDPPVKQRIKRCLELHPKPRFTTLPLTQTFALHAHTDLFIFHCRQTKLRQSDAVKNDRKFSFIAKQKSHIFSRWWTDYTLSISPLSGDKRETFLSCLICAILQEFLQNPFSLRI